MALKPGKFADFSESMAQDMEDAMQGVWAERWPDEPFPTAGEDDRRMLFVAIAQGVLRYLSRNESELTVQCDAVQSADNNIESSDGGIAVTQDGGSTNRVVSGVNTNLQLEIDEGDFYA